MYIVYHYKSTYLGMLVGRNTYELVAIYFVSMLNQKCYFEEY